MFGSGQLALPDDRKWSRGPPGCPGGPLGFLGVVRKPSWMPGSVREALPDVREWSENPPGRPEVFRRPSRMSGRPS